MKTHLVIIRMLLSLFFTCSSFGSSAQSKEPLITIQRDNISLREAFVQIEQQTDYSIAYEQSGPEPDRLQSISIKETDIDTAIRTILQNTGYTYKIHGYHIIISKANVRLQTIRGMVTDESSGHPLPFVHVSILANRPLGTTTDSMGYFTIPNVPVGRYNIKASFIGYEPRIIAEVVLTSAKETYLQIPMKENSLLLNEVVIHANIDKENTVNPLALTGGRMLTVEEASRFAGGFDDPARLVSSFAGVAGGINSNAIVVRGNSPQFTQWRMEGIEIPNPTHYADMTGLGGGLLTGLSSNVLGNSAFYNGAFPAAYTNALGGVFDMSMRNGNPASYEHAFQVGIWGLDFASEGPVCKKHNSTYLFNYRYSFSGLSDAISGTDEGLDYQDIAFKLNFPTQKQGTFTLWGIGLFDKVVSKNEEDPTQWEYTSDKQRSDNRFAKAMFGLGHKIYIHQDTWLHSTLATTYSKVHAIVDQADNDFNFHQMADMKNSHTDIILTSCLNRKFSEKHTNRTGVTFTNLRYDLDFNKSDKPGLYAPMQTIACGDGSDYALSAFTNSVFRITNTLDASIGLTGQFFSLNNHWTLEPRAAIKWKLPQAQTVAFAYGLNSIRERLDYYYVKAGNQLVNKNLNFSKAHHFSLSYSKKLSDNLFLKIEPYYQYLYNIPVEPGTSFSILNYNGYGLDKKLVNDGKGRNYGIDLTLERYLKNGWYGLITGSLFKSEYKGGDNIWRDTRMDQRFIIHGLTGKEWTFGKYRHKVFSANIRLNYQGGYKYTPIDYNESQQNQGIEEIDTNAYSLRLPSMFTTDLTLRYRVNKKRVAHEYAFMILNANGFKQTGYVYNLVTNAVEKKKSTPLIISLSWKIYF